MCGRRKLNQAFFIRAAAFSNSTCAPSRADPRCSISRDPRWEEYTICTAVAPDDVFTVRTYGDTRQLYEPRLVRTSSHHNPQKPRSAARKITQAEIVSQVGSGSARIRRHHYVTETCQTKARSTADRPTELITLIRVGLSVGVRSRLGLVFWEQNKSCAPPGRCLIAMRGCDGLALMGSVL